MGRHSDPEVSWKEAGTKEQREEAVGRMMAGFTGDAAPYLGPGYEKARLAAKRAEEDKLLCESIKAKGRHTNLLRAGREIARDFRRCGPSDHWQRDTGNEEIISALVAELDEQLDTCCHCDNDYDY